MQRWLRSAVLLGVLLALPWYALFPLSITTRTLFDPDFRRGAVPMAAYQNLAAICREYPAWAAARRASKRAAELPINDVAGTEWPLFGTVFLFWSIEQLQSDWSARQLPGPAPRETAQATLQAGADLLADPGQADWVRRYWGDDYLEEKNLFYRMMLIAGLDSFERLTGDLRHHSLLRAQVEALSAELDAAPTGLLEDYPGQTYPVDVLLAYAALARARQRLGLPNDAFVARAQRAFTGIALHPDSGLPAYQVDSETSAPLQPARGVGQSAMLAFAGELWPEFAALWFERYQQQFWQTRYGLAGFREFPRAQTDPWLEVEIDAGPIIMGYGVGASAFGLAAARAQQRPDLAVPLASEAIALAWQTPDGRMLGPRLLSNLSDAPFLGESALLFVMSRPMQARSDAAQALPAAVWAGLSLAWLLTAWAIVAGAHTLQRLWRSQPSGPR